MNEVNLLLNALHESTKLKKDTQHKKYLTISKFKKQLSNILQFELFEKSIKDIVNILATINESGEFYEKFPDSIESPDYEQKYNQQVAELFSQALNL